MTRPTPGESRPTDPVFDSETYRSPPAMRVLAVLGALASATVAIAWGAAAAAPAWTTAIIVGCALAVVVTATHVSTSELTLTTENLVFRSLLLRRTTTWGDVDHIGLASNAPGAMKRLRASWLPMLVMTLVIAGLAVPFVFVSQSTTSKALGAPALQVIIWGGAFAMKWVILHAFPGARAAATMRNGVSVISRDGTAFAYLPGRLPPEAQLALRRRCRSLGVPPHVAY